MVAGIHAWTVTRDAKPALQQPALNASLATIYMRISATLSVTMWGTGMLL